MRIEHDDQGAHERSPWRGIVSYRFLDMALIFAVLQGAHGTLYFYRDGHYRGNALYRIDGVDVACFDDLVTESRRSGGSVGNIFNAHLKQKGEGRRVPSDEQAACDRLWERCPQ